MAKVLCEKKAVRQSGEVVAIVTIITRHRGNVESVASCEIIEGNRRNIQEKLMTAVEKAAADKKVVITVISGKNITTRVYDTSL